MGQHNCILINQYRQIFPFFLFLTVRSTPVHHRKSLHHFLVVCFLFTAAEVLMHLQIRKTTIPVQLKMDLIFYSSTKHTLLISFILHLQKFWKKLNPYTWTISVMYV